MASSAQRGCCFRAGDLTSETPTPAMLCGGEPGAVHAAWHRSGPSPGGRVDYNSLRTSALANSRPR
jgi:hypothetical protein